MSTGLHPAVAPPPRLPATPWGLRRVLAGLGLGVASVVVIGVVAGIVAAVAGVSLDDLLASRGTAATAIGLSATLLGELSFFGVAYWMAAGAVDPTATGPALHRRVVLRALGFRRLGASHWWVPVAGVVLAFGIVGAYTGVLQQTGPGVLEPEENVPSGLFDQRWAIPLAALAILGAAPLSEEAFFRGFIFNGLRSRLGVVLGALASALIFALAHQSVGLFIPFAVIGVLLSAAYWYTGSLLAPVATHFLFNLVSFLVGVSSAQVAGP